MFNCSNCDAQSSKWSGRCLECGKWGTLKQQEVSKVGTTSVSRGRSVKVHTFSDLKASSLKRHDVGSFPGALLFPSGLVAGSVTLLTGEPGAGKSTLVLQIARALSGAAPVLYVTGEESVVQLKERGDRLGSFPTNFNVAEIRDAADVVATVSTTKPSIVIVDSLQTLSAGEDASDAGSINAVRTVTAMLAQCARSQQVAFVLIGHVTKDGAIAGPKTLEHIVDAVYYLESDEHSSYRLLRCSKNRYGRSGTAQVIRMTSGGFQEVPDAATVFIKDYAPRPGSVIAIAEIDSQFFFLEVQALVSKSQFGYPRRSASGFPRPRLEMLLTTIAKHVAQEVASYDVYVNIAGGFKVTEPALDVAVVAAILSSLRQTIVPHKTVFMGEIGLSGEVRTVKHTSERLKVIEEHSFERVILPPLGSAKVVHSPVKIVQAATLSDLVSSLS